MTFDCFFHFKNVTEESQQDNVSVQQISDELWDDDSMLLSSPRHEKNGVSNIKRLTSVTEEDTVDNTVSEII